MGRVWLQGHWYHVEYEGCHRICSVCGCYGHLGRDCKGVAPVSKQKETAMDATTTKETGSKTVQSPPAQNKETESAQSPPAQIKETENKDDGIPDLGGVTDKEGNKDNNGPLRGDWLVVKRRNRKNIPPKSAKPLKLANDKKGKSWNVKAHAQRESTKAHGKKIASNSVSRDPGDQAHVNKGAEQNLHNKRQRSDFDLGPSKSIMQEDPKPNPKMDNQPNTVYDLGQGAKSTVNMKAFSNNHFILLHEDVAMQTSNDHVASSPMVNDHDEQEQVVETQDHMVQ